MGQKLNLNFIQILKKYYSNINISTIPIILNSSTKFDDNCSFFAPTNKANIVFYNISGNGKIAISINGKIINISSVWGQCGGACEAAYSAAKAGIIGLTKALAKEYGNICTNCICPGVINTKMNSHLSSEDAEDLKNQIPAGRFGEPEEVAELALFLASQKADYITGQIIAVNGGMYI